MRLHRVDFKAARRHSLPPRAAVATCAAPTLLTKACAPRHRSARRSWRMRRPETL